MQYQKNRKPWTERFLSLFNNAESKLTIFAASSFVFSVVATHGFFSEFSYRILRSLTIGDYFALSVNYLYPLLEFTAVLFAIYLLSKALVWRVGQQLRGSENLKKARENSAKQKEKKQDDTQRSNLVLVLAGEELISGKPFYCHPALDKSKFTLGFIGLLLIELLSTILILFLILHAFSWKNFPILDQATFPLFITALFIGGLFYLVFRIVRKIIDFHLLSNQQNEIYYHLSTEDKSENSGNNEIIQPDAEVLEKFKQHRDRHYDNTADWFRNASFILIAIIGGNLYGKMTALEIYAGAADIETVEVSDNSIARLPGESFIRVIDQGILAFDGPKRNIIFINDEGRVVIDFTINTALLDSKADYCIGDLSFWIIRWPFQLWKHISPSVQNRCLFERHKI